MLKPRGPLHTRLPTKSNGNYIEKKLQYNGLGYPMSEIIQHWLNQGLDMAFNLPLKWTTLYE